jgi:hypothetical protein
MKHLVGASVCLVLVTLPTTRVVNHAATLAVYNSEEHKVIVDRAAGRVNLRSAMLPFPTRMLDLTAADMRAGYLAAKKLAVGYQSNDSTQYGSDSLHTQDNSYYTGYAQRSGNFKFYIPGTSEVSTRTLYVTAWDGTGDAGFTFGELVALYGDYRRTVSCDAALPSRCHLTPSDYYEYRNGGARTTGYVNFEYGTDCFLGYGCGFEPLPLRTRDYLRHIASGLWPPYGALGNTTSNTAWPEEWLDAGWWGDEMLRIANINDWHFSQAAVAWYVGMHRIALKYALLARGDNRYWVKALHYEASALHSLTDLFAYGHVVVSRDRTSWNIMSDNGLLQRSPYAWMENVLAMGGGSRDQSTGKVSVGATLLPLQESNAPRADTMSSDRGSWALVGKREHDQHDGYNASGANVMNLKRQEFYIYGDFKMRNTSAATKRIIEEAVRASLQSLFDAYEANPPLDQVAGAGSSAFDALLNVPVYVKSAGSYEGMWTRYAAAVNQLTGAGIAPDLACIIPFVDGQDAAPAARGSACSTPTAPPNSAVVTELLQHNGALGKGDVQGLDAQGNADGSYDAGDFLAWVRRTGATPASLAAKPKGGSR